MSPTGTLRAGFGRAVISPAPGVIMAGYGSRTEGAIGTHDELEARALWLDGPDEPIGLIVLDLVAADRYLTEQVRTQAADLIPGSRLVVAATHTHAGPAVRSGGGGMVPDRGVDPAVVAAMTEGAVRALALARDSAEPAELAWLTRDGPSIGANRRHGGRPDVDVLTVVGFRRPDGGPIAALLHDACHPTVLDATNRWFSPDFPGVARRRFEDLTGMPAIFVNGAAGDISTRYTRTSSTFEEVERLGAALAEAAVAMERGALYAPAAMAQILAARVTLETRSLPDVEEARAEVARSVEKLASLKRIGAAAAEQRTTEVALIGARHSLEMAERGLPREVSAEVMAIGLGGHALVTVPGELFTASGLEIARGVRAETIVMGYANGYLGYFVPAGEEGGYEAGAAIVSPTGVATLVAAATAMAGRVSEGI